MDWRWCRSAENADKSGRLIILPQFEQAGEFSEGLALAGMGLRFSYPTV
jgi:hypothetical protein